MINPKYTITPGINSRIAEIERIRAIVDRSNVLPEVVLNMRFRATVEEVHSSTTIEGNLLNKDQVKKVLAGKMVTAPEYAIKEVINYKKALDWSNEYLNKKKELNAKAILDLHQLTMEGLLPKEKVGHWRLGNVCIVDRVNRKEIVQYTGSSADKIPFLVEDLLKWLKKQSSGDLHPVLVAGILHYIFVSIHPFSDGNGRITRLLTRLYLQMSKYDFRGTMTLNSYYLQNRFQYYESLSLGKTYSARVKTDITSFLNFFTKGFLEVTKKLREDIEVAGFSRTAKKIIRLNSDEISVLDYVRQFGSITPKEIVEVFNIPHRSAQRKLYGLVEKKLLKRRGKGRATGYVLYSKSNKFNQ